MNEIIGYAPVASTWQANLAKAVQILRADDIVKLGGILGLVTVIGIGCICFSGSELTIANGKFEIKRPASVFDPRQA